MPSLWRPLRDNLSKRGHWNIIWSALRQHTHDTDSAIVANAFHWFVLTALSDLQACQGFPCIPCSKFSIVRHLLSKNVENFLLSGKKIHCPKMWVYVIRVIPQPCNRRVNSFEHKYLFCMSLYNQTIIVRSFHWNIQCNLVFSISNDTTFSNAEPDKHESKCWSFAIEVSSTSWSMGATKKMASLSILKRGYPRAHVPHTDIRNKMW